MQHINDNDFFGKEINEYDDLLKEYKDRKNMIISSSQINTKNQISRDVTCRFSKK